jgi:hypothetical protein
MKKRCLSDCEGRRVVDAKECRCRRILNTPILVLKCRAQTLLTIEDGMDVRSSIASSFIRSDASGARNTAAMASVTR